MLYKSTRRLLSALLLAMTAQTTLWGQVLRSDISLSDPFVMADEATHRYYMTGTGGKLWVSDDLELWTGPTDMVSTPTTSWMGAKPEIWASELHQVDGKYYNISTFTNKEITIDASGHPRRAVHILRSNLPNGTYTLLSDGDETYLPAEKTTLDGTLFTDTDGQRYLLYCHEWIQTGNGTVEAIPLKADMTGTEGEGTILFRARNATWNTGGVTDGPFAFRTQTGRLGILWTSWRGDLYVQGVAYSESGTMKGPWQQQPLPITPDQHGHGMLFRTFDGQLLMAIHSNRNIDIDKQHFERHPVFYVMDDSGDELRAVMEYRRDPSAANPASVVVANPGFDYGKNGWTCTSKAQNQAIASNQTGAITGNFFENWDENSFIGEICQELCVPNGTYQIRAAAFRSGVISSGLANAETVSLFANDETAAVTTTTPGYYNVTVVVSDGKLRFGLRSEKRNFKWMGIDNVSINYYGPASLTADDIMAAAEQRVYFRSKRDGKFLNAGKSWGTQAILAEHPLDFQLVELPDGRYALDSQLSNGYTDHYAGSNGYLDSKPELFNIDYREDNVVTLSTNHGSRYWGNSGSEVVDTKITNGNANAAQWELLSYDDLLATLDSATPDQPVDATFLIRCPNFGRNDTRLTAWGDKVVSGGDVTNQCAEAPAESYNIRQTVSGIPNGRYMLRVQGFYRYGNEQNAKAARQGGTERLQAQVFVNNTTKPLMSIFETTGSIPNTLEDASAKFTAGEYRQSLQTDVSNNRLSLGVKKTTGNNPPDNWTVFDNFELYYLGDTDTAIRMEETGDSSQDLSPRTQQAITTYDLEGRRIARIDARRGIYIVKSQDKTACKVFRQ